MHYGDLWVRFHDLPLKIRSKAMGKQLGGIIGVYKEVDLNETKHIGRFMRIKVKANIRMLLKYSTMVISI